uniref:Chromo domain-containing protein n=1 Tax=Ditylenchus dipsaci TaxID=166011 RepID=A0A915ED01_9BILA
MSAVLSDHDVLNEIEDEEEDEIFEVEKILDMKQRKGKRQFLIRWKGYAKEIVTNYVKENELKSSAKKTGNKLAKRGHSSTGAASTSGSQKTPRRSFMKEDDDSDDVTNDVDYKSDEVDEDAPTKKKKSAKLVQKNSTGSQPESVKKANGSSQSHMEKAVARRQNISKNMRWIEDSSDDSDNNDVEEVVINEESKSPSNIVPDSSTDVKQKTASQNEVSKTNSVSPPDDSSSFNESSLKIKIAVKNDQFSHHEGEKAQEEQKTWQRAFSSSHHHHPATPTALSTTTTTLTSQSLTFTGMYRDEANNGELCLIALDVNTKKRHVLTLQEAHAADSWALCRYFASKAKFSPNGQVAEELEH